MLVKASCEPGQTPLPLFHIGHACWPEDAFFHPSVLIAVLYDCNLCQTFSYKDSMGVIPLLPLMRNVNFHPKSGGGLFPCEDLSRFPAESPSIRCLKSAADIPEMKSSGKSRHFCSLFSGHGHYPVTTQRPSLVRRSRIGSDPLRHFFYTIYRALPTPFFFPFPRCPCDRKTYFPAF